MTSSHYHQSYSWSDNFSLLVIMFECIDTLSYCSHIWANDLHALIWLTIFLSNCWVDVVDIAIWLSVFVTVLQYFIMQALGFVMEHDLDLVLRYSIFQIHSVEQHGRFSELFLFDAWILTGWNKYKQDPCPRSSRSWRIVNNSMVCQFPINLSS